MRVLLADDHRLVRESLRKLIEEESDIRVVAEAGDGRSAITLAKQHSPDVVLMDISMPGLNGVDAIRRMKRDVPEVKICVLSMHLSPFYLFSALRAGAQGYVLKSVAGAELMEALRAVAAGGGYFSGDVGGLLADRLRGDQMELPAEVLSAREREVLQLIAEGAHMGHIARVLGISPKTVKNHRDNIAVKLQCRSVADLVKQAIRLGLTTS